jgi:hypothetical protein
VAWTNRFRTRVVESKTLQNSTGTNVLTVFYGSLSGRFPTHYTKQVQMHSILPDLNLLGLPFVVPLKANEDSSDLLKTKEKVVIHQYVYRITNTVLE